MQAFVFVSVSFAGYVCVFVSIVVDTATSDWVGVDLVTLLMMFASLAVHVVGAAVVVAGHGVGVGAADVWVNDADADAHTLYMRIRMCRRM